MLQARLLIRKKTLKAASKFHSRVLDTTMMANVEHCLIRNEERRKEDNLSIGRLCSFEAEAAAEEGQYTTGSVQYSSELAKVVQIRLARVIERLPNLFPEFLRKRRENSKKICKILEVYLPFE